MPILSVVQFSRGFGAIASRAVGVMSDGRLFDIDIYASCIADTCGAVDPLDHRHVANGGPKAAEYTVSERVE
jgi:hypothetical protein